MNGGWQVGRVSWGEAIAVQWLFLSGFPGGRSLSLNGGKTIRFADLISRLGDGAVSGLPTTRSEHNSSHVVACFQSEFNSPRRPIPQNRHINLP
jgi:hypothetical protein